MTDIVDWDDLPLAHIYPQFIWHCEAKIIANPVALRALAEAALLAVETGATTVKLMASDGEGYALEIERTNSTGLSYTRAPYIEEYAKCVEPDYTNELRARIAELEALLPAKNSAADGEAFGPSPHREARAEPLNTSREEALKQENARLREAREALKDATNFIGIMLASPFWREATGPVRGDIQRLHDACRAALNTDAGAT